MSKFIILGSQRSGTTLLRLLLDTHPDVVCFDESTSYTNWQQPNRSTAYLEGFKLPSFTELLTEYEEIADHYEGEPILFMQRGVEDCVCSMAKLPRPEGSFLNDVELSLSNWETDLERKRFQSMLPQLHAARNGHYPLFRQGALFWKYKEETLPLLQAEGYPIHAVKYEDLIQQPIITTKKICEFLGLDWRPIMLNPQNANHADLGIGRTKPQPMFKTSINRQKKGEEREKKGRRKGEERGQNY